MVAFDPAFSDTFSAVARGDAGEDGDDAVYTPWAEAAPPLPAATRAAANPPEVHAATGSVGTNLEGTVVSVSSFTKVIVVRP